MANAAPTRARAVILGGFVTLLWATSWILIRLGFEDEELAPLGFAAMRYGVAAILLLALALPRLVRSRVWTRHPHVLLTAVVYGLILYGLSQAGQFIALDLLPAATVSLFAAMAPVLTVLLALRSRHEVPDRRQVAGIALLVSGVVLFFGLELPPSGSLLGIAAAMLLAGSTATSARLGRSLAVAAPQTFGGVLGMTAVAMGAGAIALMAGALALEGVPTLSPTAWLYVGWMAVVNSAFAMTVWAYTMRTLTAVESSTLARLMTVEIALLAWLILGETLTAIELAGLGVALSGVIIVQVSSARTASTRAMPAT